MIGRSSLKVVKQEKEIRKNIIFGTWNVCTLLDKENVARSETTALIAKKLQCYNIDIAALSETRLSVDGSLKEAGGD